MRMKLTDRLAKTVGPGLFWDLHPDAPRGFLLQVTTGGSRAFRLNFRRKSDDRERRMTIGDVAAWPIEEARKRAAELRRVVDAGGDPLGDEQDKRAEPIVSELIQRYVDEALPHKAPGTQGDYLSLLRRRIEPALGRMKVTAVTQADVEKLHRAVSAEGRLRRANATNTMVHGLFEQAIRWKLCDVNPATRIKTNRENHRIRYLGEGELAALLATLDRMQEEKPDGVDMVRIALMSGARRGEVLAMTWSQLDFDKGTWQKPASATKQRRPHLVPLAAEAVELLRRRRALREGSTVVRLRRDDHVFYPGIVSAKARISRNDRDWAMLRKAAGLAGHDLHQHDLRHSFATALVGQGQSLAIIGQLLGHSQPATTARYAHVTLDPQRAAVAAIGKIVGGGKGPN